MSAGNTYAGKGSVTYSGCLTIGASGTSGSPITVTSYGTGRHRISCSGARAISITSRSYIDISSLAFTVDNTAVYLDKVSHINISDNLFDDPNTLHGVAIEGQNADSDADFVTISDNTFTGIQRQCLVLSSVNASNSSVFESVVFSGNTCTNASSAAANTSGGVDATMSTGATAVLQGWQITDNMFSAINDEDTTSSIAAVVRIQGASPSGAFFSGQVKALRITGNQISNSRGGISIAQADYPVIRSNPQDGVRANAAIELTNVRNGLIELNQITNISPADDASGVDGIGIDLDNYCYDNIVQANRISSLAGSELYNSGQGITMFGGGRNKVVGNEIVGARQGIFIGDNSGVASNSANDIQYNTVVNSTQSGIYTVFDNVASNITNNIITGSGDYGINAQSATDQTLTKNILYSNASGDYNSQTAGATDITSSPDLDASHKPSVGSPAIDAAAHVYPCVQADGATCLVSPDIGAWQDQYVPYGYALKPNHRR